MKRYFVIISLLFVAVFSYSQTVENISTKQVGDQIEVYYNIAGSNEKQTFLVTIMCAIDNKEKIVLKSITGDVGDNIEGGKSQYKATWDVLKDVEELNSAEFFVKIELKKEDKKVTAQEPALNNKWVVGYNGSFVLPAGLRFSYLGKWGGYLGLRLGNTEDNLYYFLETYTYLTETDYQNGDYTCVDRECTTYSGQGYPAFSSVFNSFSFNAGITRILLNKQNFQMHLYGGIGFGRWGVDDYQNNYPDMDIWINDPSYADAWYNPVEDSYGYYNHYKQYDLGEIIEDKEEFEIGLYFVVKKFALNVGLSKCNHSSDIVFGLGYCF